MYPHINNHIYYILKLNMILYVVFRNRNKKIILPPFLKDTYSRKKKFLEDLFFTFSMHVLLINCKLQKY